MKKQEQNKTHTQGGYSVINEHKRMRLMANAIENSSHPFLVGFKDGRIILVNHAFCLLTGFSETELRLMSWRTDLTPPEWHDLQDKTIEEVYRTKKALRYEKELFRKDGSRVPVESFIHPYLDDNGEIIYYYGFVTELTVRNQALEQLRKSQIQLQEISENMLDMYKKIDIHGNIQYANQAYNTVLGYNVEDLIGKSAFNMVHIDDRDRISNVFYTHLNTGMPIRTEYRCLRADGSYLYLETIAKWLFDGININGAILVSRDITERKIAETALRQSEEKFSKIFLCNPDIITISTLETGLFVDVNDACAELAGYSRHDIIGRTAHEIGIWVDPNQREDLINQLKAQGSLRGVEARFRIKSGEIMTALLSMEIIDIQTQPHLLTIVKNITERKKLEETLRLSEERFSKAFHASPSLMTICSFADDRFIDVNQSFYRVTGYSREEVLGHTAVELGLWKNVSDRTLMKQTVIDRGSVTNYECIFNTKSGEILGLYSGEKIDIGGIPCLLSMVMDITERKKIEAEMNRLDRMNMVGQVAASIGHEIRNPMTTVRGFLQMLKNKEEYQKDAEIYDLMIEEMDRANLIIKEFLSLAKDKLIQAEINNLNSIISNMLSLFNADAMNQDKNIEIKLQKIPDLMLDEKEIRQLMLNLVRNGLESMPAGGTLSIMTFMQERDVVLSIQDQGHGISDEVLGKIGTPFFTTKEDGIGLGLAVCYNIARRHNTTITVDTSPAGTRFNIKFPV